MFKLQLVAFNAIIYYIINEYEYQVDNGEVFYLIIPFGGFFLLFFPALRAIGRVGSIRASLGFRLARCFLRSGCFRTPGCFRSFRFGPGSGYCTRPAEYGKPA
jgi:glycopeptide antibiotics resistance protein